MFGSYGSRSPSPSQPLLTTRSFDLALAFIAVLIGAAISPDGSTPLLTPLLFILLTVHTYLLKVRVVRKFPLVDFTPVPIAAASFALRPLLAPLIMFAAVLLAETGRKSSTGKIISAAFREMGEYGLPAVLAAGVYGATGGHLPLTSFELHNAIRLGGAMLIYSLTYGVVQFLRAQWKWKERQPIRFVLVQLVLLMLAALIALYHHTLKETSYFALFILLIGAAMWLIQSIGVAQIAMSRHLHELTSLNRIGQAMTSNLSLDDLLATIYAQVQTLCPVSTFYIAFYDKEQVSFPFVVQKQEPCTWAGRPAGNGLPEYIIRTRQALALPDHMEERLKTLGLVSFGEETTCYLGVPLLLGDDVLGVMAIQPDRCDNSCIQTNRELFTTVAAQAAIAIRNARLFQETEAVTNELYNLVETSRQFTASLNLDQVAETIIQGLKNLISIKHGSLCLWQSAENTFQLLAHASTLSASLTEQLINSRSSVLTQAMSNHTASTLILHAPDTEKEWSALLLPLVVHERGIGMAVLWDHDLQTLTPHERHLLDGMLHQAATALQNALIFSQTDETLQDRVIALSAIEVISRQMSATLDIKTIINDVLAAAIAATDASAGCCALLISPNQYEVVAHLDAHGSQLNIPFTHTIEHGVIGRVLRSEQPVVVPDTGTDPECFPMAAGMRSELCVPIRREDRTIGVLKI